MITIDPINGILLLAVLWLLYERRRVPARHAHDPAPAIPPAPQPAPEVSCMATHHKVQRLNEAGEWDTVSEHAHHEGICGEIKDALRRPGWRVQWSHGVTEEGRE